MVNEQCNATNNHMHHMKCFSWSAVIVGAFVGVGLSFLLNLFNIAIGLSIVKTTSAGLTTLAIGGFIGVLIGSFVAMFVAGFSAGYLGKPFWRKQNLGILYGFTTWFTALILMVIIASPIGNYVSAYSTFVANPTVTVINTPDTPDISSTDNYVKLDANLNTDNNTVVVNPQTAINKLDYSAFIIFILFFIAALASCLGGYCGMCCRYSHDECDTPVSKTL